MKIPTMWITGLIFAVSGVVHAQHVFRTYAGEAYANVDLPAHVKATDGELTLWADFEKRSQEGTPLYLVNKTRGTVSFPSQDGDIYIKLESFDKTAVGAGRRHTNTATVVTATVIVSYNQECITVF